MQFSAAAPGWARRWLTWGVASAALLSVCSLHANEAGNLLGRMAESAREQSYQGDFVYERSGSFSTHRVWRQAEGEVVERLLRTDGILQEWVRRDGQLQCTSVPNAAIGWPANTLIGAKSRALDQWYSLQVLGVSRVANRAVTVVAVKPRDAFRYAYELYLDIDSGLLLQSLMINGQGALLERFQFTTVDLGPVATKRLGATASCLAVSAEASEAVTDDRWLPAWLPPGFSPVRREMRQLHGDDKATLTQVFTDGLSRFTVFVEPLAENQTADDLRAQLGPTVAISRRLQRPDGRYLATVVGEVPPLAAERVAASLSMDFDPDAVIETAP